MKAADSLHKLRRGKNNNKRVVVLILKLIFFLMFFFKTCHLDLDTGNNIHLGEILVGHRASISSLCFSMIGIVVGL